MRTGALIMPGKAGPGGIAVDPLTKIGSISIVKRQVITLRLVGVEPIAIAVSPQDQERLEKDIGHLGVVFLRDDAPAPDTLQCVKDGLFYLSCHCEQIIIAPTDAPMFSAETLRRLMESGKPLTVPAYDGKWGYPVMISGERILEILSGKGVTELDDAIQRLSPVQIPVGDQGILVRPGNRTLAEAMAAQHDLSRWRPIVRLQIAKESVFFGPGSKQLLELIDRSGSVRLATEQMGISYSKAWRILNTLESQLGYTVLNRKQGGRHGGETSLTDRGKELLETYGAFERECVDMIDSIFDRYFGNLQEPRP